MKTNWIYSFALVLLFGCLFSCSDDKEEAVWVKPEACNTLQQLIKENSLLKEVVRDKDSYTFLFETQTVILSSQDVENVVVDIEKWNTTLTLQDHSIMEIPTLGSSIAAFIASVNVNPSGYNPLAAEIRLNLPCSGRIRVAVLPKEGSKTPVQEHLFAYTSEKVQFIDVLGLYADYINKVELTFTDEKGKERAHTTIEIKTAPLNISSLPVAFHVAKIDVEQMEPGLNLVNFPGMSEGDTSVPYMVDADGEIRWILDWRKSDKLLHIGAQCGLYRMKNGNYIVGDANNQQLAVVNVLGEIVHLWDLSAMGYNFHHEVMEAENGNLLVTVTKKNAKRSNGKPRINDHIIEFDPVSNALVHEWDLANMLDSARYDNIDENLPGAEFGQTSINWAHNNSIKDWGESYLAGVRFQGIFKYDRNGKVAWIISPHKKWREEYKKYLLTPLDKNGNVITDEDIVNGDKSGSDFDWVWGVHAPIVLPNGHILAFDNGYCRNFIARPLTDSRQYSRAVEYEVDEKNMTVRQVWAFGTNQHQYYAPAMSNVAYLKETGNILFTPGLGNTLSNGKSGSRIMEINPRTNEIIFELEIDDPKSFHRANRISLYPADELE